MLVAGLARLQAVKRMAPAERKYRKIQTGGRGRF
jgi:hypothetical protein